MMNDIKFRAWDTLNNKYFENTYEAYKDNLEILQIGLNGRLQLITSLERRDESLFPDRFIIQQYTGLKDKDGAEIYEGDIVQTRWQGNKKGVVVFENSTYCVDIGNGYMYFNHPESYEVIGNIHQHPDLLGDSQ